MDVQEHTGMLNTVKYEEERFANAKTEVQTLHIF